MSRKTRAQLEADYERTAGEYQARLTLFNYAQSVPQANQHSSFQLSFAQIQSRRPDIHPFNELLVQYEFGRPARRRQVLPDNMVVLHDGDLNVYSNFALPLQPARPLLVLDYPCEEMGRKDYRENFRKYERELEVPYCLVHDMDSWELTLFVLRGRRYAVGEKNGEGRFTIPELELEAGVIDRHLRYWFRGRLIPSMAEMAAVLFPVADDLPRLKAELDRVRAA